MIRILSVVLFVASGFVGAGESEDPSRNRVKEIEAQEAAVMRERNEKNYFLSSIFASTVRVSIPAKCEIIEEKQVRIPEADLPPIPIDELMGNDSEYLLQAKEIIGLLKKMILQ